jgi:flagellar basal-body rod modification protein FlgD
MFATPLTTAQIDAYNADQGKTKNKTDASSMQDKFMKMLVAQMKNQDPLNPMDNAQMTSQMAQINTVGGIEQLNKTMTAMATQFGNLQALQGVSLIGKVAMIEGNTPTVENGKAYGGLELTKAANSVKVDILGKGGDILGTVDMGAQTAGQHFFEVPLTGVDPTKVASFKVTATNGTATVAVKNISLQAISSVGMKDGALSLTSATGKTFAYTDVLGYR